MVLVVYDDGGGGGCKVKRGVVPSETHFSLLGKCPILAYFTKNGRFFF